MEQTTLERRERSMKMIVIKSPKYLAGLLRVLFGIKKDGET